MSELFLSKVAYAVLSGLSFMKSKGFIHRDVKPSNILINRQGDIKLCDFGISQKLINSISKTINKGCRPYMPVSCIKLLSYYASFMLWPISLEHHIFLS